MKRSTREKRLAAVKRPEYARRERMRQLLCWNEFWTAQAWWNLKDGIWVCVEATPEISWMRKMSPENAKLNLARRGCQWQWV